MNKQIRVLATVAGYGDRWNSTEEFEIFLARFAQLIIQECAHIAYEYDLPKMSGPGMIIGGRIEEHFGIE